MNHIIVLAGPGGAGKNTILEKLLQSPIIPNLVMIKKWTTRAKRPHEQGGGEFDFITPEAFKTGIRLGKLLEHNLFNGQYYGVPRHNLEEALQKNQNPILILEYRGTQAIRRAYPHQSILIFITAPTNELRSRYIARGQSIQEADDRLAIAIRDELPHQTAYDLVVENRTGHLEEAVTQISQYIQMRQALDQKES